MIGEEGTALVADNPAVPTSTDDAGVPIGPFQMDDDALIRKLSEWRKECTSAMVEERPKRKKDWSYYAGDQWEKEDLDRAKAQRRPALTLNMLLSIISAVEGEERTNRQEMKFWGEGAEDDPAAYGINRLVKWIMDQCGGQFALSKQFRSGIICGEGWVVPEVDYFDDPNGKIKLVYVDDEEIDVDPLSTDETANDARYLQRTRMMAEDEGEARWPGFREKVRQVCLERGIGPETDGSGSRDIYSTSNDPKSPKLYDAQKNLWAVVETWWHQIEPGWVMVDEQTGLLVEKTDEEFQGIRTQRQQEQIAWLREAVAPRPIVAQPLPDGSQALGPAPMPPKPQPLQATQRPIRRFYQAFHTFETLLAKQPSPLPRLKRFPYVAFRGMYDKVKKEWFGLTRPIIDPQRQHNVEQSIIVQMMQLQPKASWMAPKGAYHEKVKWENQLATPGSLLEYNAQRGKPEPIPVQPIPRHLVDMAFQRPQTMREISGVNVEMTGQRQGSDAGVVMEQRQKAAKTVLAPLFDSYRASKMQLGHVLLAYIQAYVPVGRRIRVLGPEAAEYVPMTQDMALGDYDLVVDETSETINDRIATLNILQTTLPTLMKAGVPVPPAFVDMMPMPPHIRNEWKRLIAWQMTINNQLPPPGWQPGMPNPALAPPMAPGMPPGAPPAPAAPPMTSPPPQ